MNPITITCPHCKKEVELTEALTHDVGRQLEEKYKAELLAEKRVLWQKAQQEAGKKFSEELQETQKALRDAQQVELTLRREKRAVEEEKKNIELTVARKLDEERKRIEETAVRQASEREMLKQRELEKKLQDALVANDDLRRKLQQGSQQTQGEVLELELESKLREAFPYDTIAEVPKGIRGADIIQTVHDQQGATAGSIIWELKRTKQWSDGWVAKLKEDQRAVKAEVAVLVTEALPKTVSGIGRVQGVWVTSFATSIGIAMALRTTLLQALAVHASYENKKEKMDVLYTYVTGVEFRQRVEAIVESFVTMHTELDQEKRAFEKIWARREKQIQTVIANTLGMHGELQGLLGNALQDLKVAQLPGDTQ